MKILALIDVATGTSIEAVKAEITNELKGSWDLFASGVLREAYATAAPGRVVFVLEADDIADAQAYLHRLPLVAAGLLHTRYHPAHEFACVLSLVDEQIR
jgi:hypothetical protein